MSKLSFAAICLLAVVVAFLTRHAVPGAEPTPERAKTITVWELQNSQVIGWLGQPLGKIVTVEGVIADGSYTRMKADAGCTLIRVKKVDGKELPKECVFHYPGSDNPKVDSHVKFIGYETGGFTGVPKGAWEYILPYATTLHYFSTYLVLLRNETGKK